MANKPWHGTAWEKTPAPSFETREVFQGNITSFQQVRNILEEADALKEELGEGWEIFEEIDTYGNEEGCYTEGFFTFRRYFSDEELNTRKKQAWEEAEKQRLLRERANEEKDFQQYQALRKKFENLGENLL